MLRARDPTAVGEGVDFIADGGGDFVRLGFDVRELGNVIRRFGDKRLAEESSTRSSITRLSSSVVRGPFEPEMPNSVCATKKEQAEKTFQT